MLTIRKAAEVLRISRTTVYKLAEDWPSTGGRDGLSVVKLGRRLVVRRVDLAALVGLPATSNSRGLGYSIRSPEMARAITSCWICSVPSKMS